MAFGLVPYDIISSDRYNLWRVSYQSKHSHLAGCLWFSWNFSSSRRFRCSTSEVTFKFNNIKTPNILDWFTKLFYLRDLDLIYNTEKSSMPRGLLIISLIGLSVQIFNFVWLLTGKFIVWLDFYFWKLVFIFRSFN